MPKQMRYLVRTLQQFAYGRCCMFGEELPRGAHPKLICLLVSTALIGCTSASTMASRPAEVAVTPPLFVAADAGEALPHLVAAERSAAGERNLSLLAELWAPDARIIDRRATADPADDYVWAGRAAILDRYVVAVFPSPPAPLDALPTMKIQMDGDTARAHLGNDDWAFVRRDGRWWLLELAY